MARKGATQWEIQRQLTDTSGGRDGVEYFRHYALRSDGKLLMKLRTVEEGGKLRHDYGWKLCPRSTQEQIKKYGAEAVKQQLLEKGFR